MVDLEIKPLVSIIITSFNRAKWIGNTIQSALDQDYPNVEIIISDNQSTDNSDTVIKKYIHEKRIKYFVNDSNIGMMANFKKATEELAKGEYITYVSSDDYFVNKKFISDSINKMLEYSNVNAVCAKVLLLNQKNNKIIESNFYKCCKNIFYKKNYVSGIEVFLKFPSKHSVCFGGYLFKRRDLNKIISFNNCIFGDTLIILQLLCLGDIAFIKDDTYVFRQHENNTYNKNLTGDYFIDNLDFIIIPYNFALNNCNIKKEKIENWKEKMLFQFIRYGYIVLGRSKKEEFIKLNKYIESNFPKTHKKIRGDIRYNLHKNYENVKMRLKIF